jgi:hypothetical protein
VFKICGNNGIFYKSNAGKSALVAQPVEHIHGKDGVAGSIPAEGSIVLRARLRACMRKENEGCRGR